MKKKSRHSFFAGLRAAFFISFSLMLSACGVDELDAAQALPEQIEAQTVEFIEQEDPLASASSDTAENTPNLSPELPAQLSSDLAAANQSNGQSAGQLTGQLTVHVIDVGQGDSIFIQLPNGENMLIDGGEAGYAASIREYLQSLDVTRIDYLIATHPHSDHIGGLPDIIDRLDIGQVYMPRIEHTSVAYFNLLDSIENKGLKPVFAKAGVDILVSDALQVKFVAPVKEDYQDMNDHSAVIHIRYGGTGFLLTGDAEAASENDIAADIAADVLKVGHHGSDSSTGPAFLERVSPAYAVISVGSGNGYGHPSESVLAGLQDAGASVLRTDLQGTIVFTSDGESITVNKEPAPMQMQGNLDPKSVGEETPIGSSPLISANFIGNQNSNVFHEATCGSVSRMAEHNKVPFGTRDEAVDAGMRSCQNCSP